VMQGKLEITVDETNYKINKDQCVRFIANRPHKYYSAGKQMVSAIMMICYLA
jgi:mannose-6-phosphate isomerase-like protein (cupin superfamily)